MVVGVVRPFVVGTHFSRDAATKHWVGTAMSTQRCDPPTAVSAVEEALSAQAAIPSDVEESADEAGVVRDPNPKGTLEEAQSREHQMTHLPKNFF